MAKQKPKNSKGSKITPNATRSEIPESEQWRIIKDSGILDRDSNKMNPTEGPPDAADEVFNAVLYIVPFSFLYLMMDILIQQQYGKHPSAREYLGRFVSAIPVLSVFIFYTIRHKARRATQMGLLLVSLAVGTRLIWLVNRAPWHITIRQGPPLATIWIFTITALDLLPAVGGLSLVAVWVWWYDMKLVL